jgi:transmembrane sensor
MTEAHRQHLQQDARRRITEQAAAWYLDLHDEDLHDEPRASQRAEFLAWLKHSPAHVAEYLAIAQLHGHLPDVAALDPHDAQQLEALAATESAVVPLRRPPLQPVPVRALHVPPRSRNRYRRVGGWLAVGAAALLAIFVMPRLSPEPLPSAVTYTNDDDTIRSVSLPDGSLVQLDRNSAIAVRFDAHRRDIDMLRGGAVFDVGRDPARPLQVRVGTTLLRDIGTIFAVQPVADGHRVTVMSGRVDLLTEAAPWRATWSRLLGGDGGQVLAKLGRGQQAIVDERGGVTHVETAIATAQAVAWLPRDIHFQDSAIGDVARRFNAYTTRPIVIDDASVAAIRISGRFHANDPESFLAYLAAMPGIRVERGGDVVRIRSARRL